MKNKTYLLAYLSFIGILIGCSLDDRYHYTVSHRINNQTQSLISGILILDRKPSIEFEIDAGKTIELYTRDGGDGPNITPPSGYSISAKVLHINTKDSLIIIDVESIEKWEYTTEKSTGIYTFSITEDLLNP